jgi:ribonuclease BN (tRNA processing enzyme)
VSPASDDEVRQVPARARAAAVQKLVLTYLLSSGEARMLFAGEVYVARDGLVLEV